MSDREIFDKYRLRNILYARFRKKQVMEMLHKYKNAFNLRDEIVT